MSFEASRIGKFYDSQGSIERGHSSTNKRSRSAVHKGVKGLPSVSTQLPYDTPGMGEFEP